MQTYNIPSCYWRCRCCRSVFTILVLLQCQQYLQWFRRSISLFVCCVSSLTTTGEIKCLKRVWKRKDVCKTEPWVIFLSLFLHFHVFFFVSRYTSFLSLFLLLHLSALIASFSSIFLPPHLPTHSFCVSFRPDSLALTSKWIVKHLR